MNTFNCARIIPALAGNTRSARKPTSCSSDHPRSRGEYVGALTTGPQNAGSSPLSRGIQSRHRPGFVPDRIIPALAGNTLPLSISALAVTDHPRSRGEYPAGPVLPAGSVGSSPLSRGIPEIRRWFKMSTGIIPALAGNTCLLVGGIDPHQDHPRSRGEYLCCL